MAHFISNNHLIQAVIIGAVLAFLTANLIINAKIRSIQTNVNGWKSSLQCGRPGSGMLLRAASAKFLPAVNLAEEAVYWLAARDDQNKPLNSRHAYLLHFPAGQTPPNNAFWSLTATDLQGYLIENSSGRQSIGDHSALQINPDGSIDIFIQRQPPDKRECNWLPVPAGNFKLTLRADLPGPAVLDGSYKIPAVIKVG